MLKINNKSYTQEEFDEYINEQASMKDITKYFTPCE